MRPILEPTLHKHTEQPRSRHLGVLNARRVLDLVALGIVPAAAAGLLAFAHTNRPYWGGVVAICILVVNQLVSRTRYPLHLMPVARLAMCGLTPFLGALLAWAAALATGMGSLGDSLIPAVAGAVPLAALGCWVRDRFDRNVGGADRGDRRPGGCGGAQHGDRRGKDSRLPGPGLDLRRWPTSADLAPGVPHLGSIEGLRRIVPAHQIELLVHAQGPGGEVSRLDIFEGVGAACLDLPVRLIEASQFYEELLGPRSRRPDQCRLVPVLMHPRYRRTPTISKRLFDFAIGSVALVVAAPLIALFAVAIKLSDGGPVFYRQRRIGEGGRDFEMVKLRSMRAGAQADGAQWSSRDDDRVLPVGRVMRKLHIDELPQLWNVLRGEMTLVGPRPEQPELVAELERRFPHYERRSLVKPGITGWAQVRCGYAGTKEGSAWKLCHDLYYLKHRSLLADLMIILETARALGQRAQFDLEAPSEQFIVRSEPGPAVAMTAATPATAQPFRSGGGGGAIDVLRP